MICINVWKITFYLLRQRNHAHCLKQRNYCKECCLHLF